MAACHRVQHVPQRRAGRRGDNADALGIWRHGAFAFGGKQALGRQLAFQPLKGRLECPHALKFHLPDDELVLAPSLINREIPL